MVGARNEKAGTRIDENQTERRKPRVRFNQAGPTCAEVRGRKCGRIFRAFWKNRCKLGLAQKCWAMLLQTVLIGKAQRVYATLSPEGCPESEAVKMAVLKSFELVPEAYRQKFWDMRKENGQSYIEFLSDKEWLLDKWCPAKDVREDIEKLRQVILIEEFVNCMSEELRVHLRYKKITTGYELAAVADEYVITHKRSRDRIDIKSQNECRLNELETRKNKWTVE